MFMFILGVFVTLSTLSFIYFFDLDKFLKPGPKARIIDNGTAYILQIRFCGFFYYGVLSETKLEECKMPGSTLEAKNNERINQQNMVKLNNMINHIRQKNKATSNIIWTDY